jgi:hypothetical protein
MIATLSDLQTIPITIPINVDITIHANNVHKKYPSDAGSAAWKNTGAVRIISVQTTIELIMLLIAIDKNTCHNLIPPIMYALLISPTEYWITFPGNPTKLFIVIAKRHILRIIVFLFSSLIDTNTALNIR